eukprot:2014792-Amphidinium_carterae.1
MKATTASESVDSIPRDPYLTQENEDASTVQHLARKLHHVTSMLPQCFKPYNQNETILHHVPKIAVPN